MHQSVIQTQRGQLRSCCSRQSHWQVENPLPQRIFDQFFHNSEKTDFINTDLTPLYVVFPFVFSQIFTQRN